MPDCPNQIQGRMEALESVRGLAAFVVCCSHLFTGFFPHWFYNPADPLPPWLQLPSWAHFAVDVFFVLSGFVLSISFVQTGKIELLRTAFVRRYWRLFIPVAASILISYLLHANGLYANREAVMAFEANKSDWLYGFYGFEPSAVGAIREAVWKVFFSFSARESYNPVLWTMGYEFLGSLFLFAFLALSGGLRNRFLIYLAVGFVAQRFGMIWLLEFLAGAAVCEFSHMASVARVIAHPFTIVISH
jgi:peptidoglycan/LPS O-acetylase OafA/YrhL